MDLTELSSRARFQVGDRVRLEAGDTWVVTGRYWRKSTREIVYDITVQRLHFTARRPEWMLRRVREEEQLPKAVDNNSSTISSST